MDLVKTKLTVNCYTEATASGYAKAQVLAGLVRVSINPTGVNGSVIWNSTVIDHCVVSQIYDNSINPKNADEFGFPCASVDVTMFWMECQS